MAGPYAPLNLPSAWQLVIKYDQNGQEAVNVLGGRPASGSWGLSAAAPQAQLDAWWAQMKTFLDDNLNITEASARQAIPEGVVVPLTPPTGNGSKIGSSPAAYCAVVQWGTNVGGRGGRGRCFVPGVASSDIDGAGRTLLSAYRTSLQTAVNNYLGAAFTGGWVPVVLSRSDAAAHDIVQATVSANIGIQRRRMRA